MTELSSACHLAGVYPPVVDPRTSPPPLRVEWQTREYMASTTRAGAPRFARCLLRRRGYFESAPTWANMARMAKKLPNMHQMAKQLLNIAQMVQKSPNIEPNLVNPVIIS